jgi:hypothetical protein
MTAPIIVVMIAIKTVVMTATLTVVMIATTAMVVAVVVHLQEWGVALVGAALHHGWTPSAKFATKKAILPVTAGLAMTRMTMAVRRFMMLIAWTQTGTWTLVPHITPPGSSTT